MDTALPPVPSDEALAAAQEMLPALGDLFRCITDGDTHAKMIAELREESTTARAEAAKVAEAHAELEAARLAHAEAIARERREHQDRMVAEEKRRGAEFEKREKAMKAREQWTAEQASAAEADRAKAAETLADVERRLAVIRSAAG